MGLFSQEEFTNRFLTALTEISDKTFSLTWLHEHRPTEGPRMSGLGSCGRQQGYAAADVPITNEKDPVNNWPALLGGIGQTLSSHVLRTMGYTVENEELEVTLDGISGHLDGEITGLDLEDEVVIWDSKFRNIWALYGTKANYGLVTYGLPYASIDIWLQLQAYIAARGRKRAIVTAHPFDMSAAKRQAAIAKVEAQPVYRLVIDSDEEAQQLAITRGKIVAASQKMGATIAPEFDPYRDNFPCNYCPWKSRCMLDGQKGDIMMPPIPSKWKSAPQDLAAFMEVA